MALLVCRLTPLPGLSSLLSEAEEKLLGPEGSSPSPPLGGRLPSSPGPEGGTSSGLPLGREGPGEGGGLGSPRGDGEGAG